MHDLWIDFVNSDWHDHLGREKATDRLEDPTWIRGFFARAGLPGVDPERPQVRQSLKELRGLLQQIVATALAKKTLSDSQLASLNRYLGGPQVRPRLVRETPAFRLDLAPLADGLPAAQFAIAQSLANFLIAGEFKRLKVCENPACRWLFYDSTRSRTRRWCASNCGSLIKVRRFRKRQRKQGQKKNR